jgi:hypothetical protein
VSANDLHLILQPLLKNPLIRWKLVQRGQWVHGVRSPGEYLLDLARYQISDVVDQIHCPTLIATAEGDPASSGAEQLFEALTCSKRLIRFSASEGTQGHCEAGNRLDSTSRSSTGSTKRLA